MRKIIFLAMFFLILFGSFAQASPENQWLIGTWVDNDGDVWVFHNNGTVSLSWEPNTTFFYSINNSLNLLIFIYQSRNIWVTDAEEFFRINDQQMVISWEGEFYFLNKRN